MSIHAWCWKGCRIISYMWLNYRLEILIPLSKHDIWWKLKENIEKTMIVQERELGVTESKHLHVDLCTWARVVCSQWFFFNIHGNLLTHNKHLMWGFFLRNLLLKNFWISSLSFLSTIKPCEFAQGWAHSITFCTEQNSLGGRVEGL